MKRLGLLGVALLAMLAPTASAATTPGPAVTLDQKTITAVVGQILTIESRITDPAAQTVAHINVTSLDGTYVDLEDWSLEVTAPVPAGSEAKLDWELQAVNVGRFAVYVVLVPDGGEPMVVSSPVEVTVAARRSLDAGGALPVALAVPALVGLTAIAGRFRRTGR